MTYVGTVTGGKIVLQPEVHLPEGSKVVVELLQHGTTSAAADLDAAEIRNGLPLLPSTSSPQNPDLTIVNQLRDEVS